MRWSSLTFALVLGVTAASGQAHADKSEKVKTNQSAKLYSHPGEAGDVLLTIKSGQTMTVLSKDGRWLKVRVNGRTGYIPRTKVDLPDDEADIQRNTRRRPFVDGRGTGRGFNGEAGPDDRVGADATGATGTKDDKGDKADPPDDSGDDTGDGGDAVKPKPHAKPDKPDKPDKPKVTKDKSKTKPKADPDEEVVDDGEGDGGKADGGKADKGTKDKDDGDGDAGGGDKADPADTRPIVHITSASAKAYEEANKTSAVAFKAKPEDKLYIEDKKGKWTEVSSDDGSIGWVLTSQLDMDSVSGGSVSDGKRLIDLRARVGASVISQGLRSAGPAAVTAVPDNYNFGASTATFSLGGQYLMPYGSNYLIGGEATYDYSKSLSGVAYMGSNINFAMHDVNVRAEGGYDLHKPSGMTIFGRLGYRYQSFLINDVTNFAVNTAKIPSEVDKGPSIGAALWVPHLTPMIGIRASLDAMIYSVNQTVNLEDGASPSAKGIDLGGAFNYHWKANMDLQATYDLNYGSYSFGGPAPNSQRGHMGTSVSRTDIYHVIGFGITRSL